MMAPKNLVLVLLLLSTSTVKVQSQNAITDLIAAALAVLGTIIQGAIDLIAAVCTAAKQLLGAILDQIINGTTYAINLALQPLIAAIDVEEDRAKSRGVDVSGCEELKTSLLDLAPSLNNEIKDKVTTIIQDEIKALDAEYDDIRNLTKIIDDLEEQFRKCNSILCFPKILATVLKWTATIPGIAEDMAKQIGRLVTKTIAEATALAENEAKIGIQKAREITNSTLECILASPTRGPTSSTEESSTGTTPEGGEPTNTEDVQKFRSKD